MADDDVVKQIIDAAGKKGITADGVKGGQEAISGFEKKIAELRALASQVSDSTFVKQSSSLLGKLFEDLKKDDWTVALEKFGKRLNSILVESLGIDFSDLFDANTLEASANKVTGAIKGALSVMEIDIPDINDVSLEGLKKKFQSLFLGFDPEEMLKAAGTLGAIKGFDAAALSFKKISEESKKVLGNLDSYRATAGEISKIQINPFATNMKVNDATGMAVNAAMEFQEHFAKEVIDLNVGLSISPSDAESELKTIYSNLENYGQQLAGIEIKLDSDKSVIGAQAIAYAARATGTDISAMAAEFNEMTFTMGSSGPEAFRNIETIGKAAANTILPVSRFQKEVMTAAGHFSLFGDNTEEAAAMLDRFIGKADPKRIGASVAAFQSVATGIANMTDEMKAFVGMGTELAGGGGAIEAIVRMDEALQSGDKDALQGIFNEAIARIEELSGAPVMTLKEAVSSGQESTFYQQAKMLEQMNLSKGSAQASDIFEASKRGTLDVESIRAQTSGIGLGGGAVAKTRIGRGGLELAEEEMKGAADLARYQLMYQTGAESIMLHSDNLAKKFTDLGQAVTLLEDPLTGLELYKTKKEPEAKAAVSPAAAKSEAIYNTQRLNRNETDAANAASIFLIRSQDGQATNSIQEKVAETAKIIADLSEGETQKEIDINELAKAWSQTVKVELTMAPGAHELIRATAAQAAKVVVNKSQGVTE